MLRPNDNNYLRAESEKEHISNAILIIECEFNFRDSASAYWHTYGHANTIAQFKTRTKKWFARIL